MEVVVFLVTFEVARAYTSDRFLPEKAFSQETWRRLFYVLLGQYSFASLIIALGNQTVRKYGRDVFFPMMMGSTGSHVKNREYSSTALAENLGHSRNSSLVQEFMLDINKCLYAYGATSISMLAMKSLLHGRCQGRMSISVKSSSSPVMNCLKGEAVGMSRNMGSFLLLKQGLIVVRLPPLKLGDMKRDIAYHGDTVNTASRIQALCNTLNKKFLVSQRFYDLISNEEGITAEFLGIFLLKGKEKSVDIYSIATER